jgi:hypothetical protein
MNNSLHNFLRRSFLRLIFFFFLFNISVKIYSQTPGLIIERATGASAAVLDPNGDGYVSASEYDFEEF